MQKKTILNIRGIFEPPRLSDRIGCDFTLFFTDKIIVNSKDLLPRTIQHSFLPSSYIESKRWIYVPNGINTNFWIHPKEDESYDIAFLGNMQQKLRILAKGFTYFVKACQLLYGDNQNHKKKVVIIGQCDVPLLKKISGDFDEDYFDFVGQISSKKEIMHYLAKGKIFVLSSVVEGMPNALMEAMALGRPCIATRVGAVSELIEDGKSGIIVPPKDIQALADAIKMLLSNDKYRVELGRAARIRMHNKFSWARSIRDTEYFYNKT